MSHKIAPFIDIVRLEDKETKLKSFARTVLEQAAVSRDSGADSSTILLVVRSVESPVAKAVAALIREGTITASVKTVFALLPSQEASTEGVSETMSALVGAHGARVIRDVRLFDAHEQLVLGPSASWVGDCMRRDPMKRDAYECFAADCSETARWARISFERLWAICDPLPDELLPSSATHIEAACLTLAADEAAKDPAHTTSS